MATTDRRATTLALAHALSAAERGLAVIPLARTKLPALRSPHRDAPASEPFACRGECGRFGHGVHDASTDPDRVRALFAAAPWATGYGIACGLPPHHLIGVDLDTKSAAAQTDSATALRELALRHLFTIPPTVVVLTPSGGRHLWLTGPPDHVVPNSAGRLAPGIDIRAPAATSSAPAPAPATAPTRSPPARPTSGRRPVRPRSCACCSRPRPAYRRRTGGRRARPRPVRPGRPRGPAQHPPLLGGLPRLRERRRRGPPRPLAGRRPDHRADRTRGPRDDRVGGPHDGPTPLTAPEPRSPQSAVRSPPPRDTTHPAQATERPRCTTAPECRPCR